MGGALRDPNETTQAERTAASPEGRDRSRAPALHIRQMPFPQDRTLRWVPPGRAPASDSPAAVFTQAVLRVIHEHARTGKQSRFGFLLGDLYRCPKTGRHYTLVDTVVPAADPYREETGETCILKAWSRSRDAFLRRSGILLGWYHSHPGGAAEMSDEDAAVFRKYFREGWQTALVVVPDQASHSGAVFRQVKGAEERVEAVPFHEFLEGSGTDAPAASVIQWRNYERQAVDLGPERGAPTGRNDAPTPAAESPRPSAASSPGGRVRKAGRKVRGVRDALWKRARGRGEGREPAPEVRERAAEAAPTASPAAPSPDDAPGAGRPTKTRESPAAASRAGDAAAEKPSSGEVGPPARTAEAPASPGVAAATRRERASSPPGARKERAASPAGDRRETAAPSSAPPQETKRDAPARRTSRPSVSKTTAPPRRTRTAAVPPSQVAAASPPAAVPPPAAPPPVAESPSAASTPVAEPTADRVPGPQASAAAGAIAAPGGPPGAGAASGAPAAARVPGPGARPRAPFRGGLLPRLPSGGPTPRLPAGGPLPLVMTVRPEDVRRRPVWSRWLLLLGGALAVALLLFAARELWDPFIPSPPAETPASGPTPSPPSGPSPLAGLNADLELAIDGYSERRGDFELNLIGCDLLADGYAAADEAFVAAARVFGRLGDVDDAAAEEVEAFKRLTARMDSVNGHFDSSQCARPR